MTKSQRQKGKSITRSSRRGKRGRRRPARKPAGEAPRGRSGAGLGGAGGTRRGEGRTLRCRDRKTPLRQGGRPSLSAHRRYCPGGGPRRSTRVRGAGRGARRGADVTSRGLREGEERRERQQSAAVPGRNSQTRGSAARTSPNKLGFSPVPSRNSPHFSLLKFFPPGR